MEFNFLAILVAAVVPMVLGFLWYNPAIFGKAWMRESGMTEEKMKSGNMGVIFGVSFLLAILLAFFLPTVTNHQMGAFSLVQGELGELPSYEAFMSDYKDEFRTFKHGAFHGALLGIFFVLPIMGTNGLFERKSWKHIFINVGYWTLTLAVMGAIVCGWR
ncbi:MULTISPECIES: DUF1761 domain-containing protein [Winogradskyella]|uniref:DUF1761 family protein n=1 Tax=Winogradskyella ouciana TaxID=2608631 RepID=A0A7K1GCZ8_9FLAO|nr:DUF1761 domain-containing protein [Winogradskyella ouciana]MTE27176.1 DUF1761 family protein [Winogradskyella ouciana]